MSPREKWCAKKGKKKTEFMRKRSSFSKLKIITVS